MTRDGDRAAVYGAEDLVFAETLFAEPLGASGVTGLAAALRADDWWRSNGVAFEVVPARRESDHSSARLARHPGDIAQIRLAIHAEDAATLAHEAAHLVASIHGADSAHGDVFRSAEIDVVTVLCGTSAADRLARSFAAARLGCAPRAWTAPSPTTERGIYGRWRVARLTATPRR
ncbi:MAG: hypothetical protein JST73_08030 [Actinobacteria bacterium]|nr:hypothetical protein [Actinomycetota bacterium]